MHKLDLIAEIASDLGRSKADVDKVVNALLSKINDTLANGEEVNIRQFGVFKIKTKSARTGRNPRTGEALQIPERKVVAFSPSSELGK